MSAEKRIVIQHTDGKFYKFEENLEFDICTDVLMQYPDIEWIDALIPDSNLDFPIGSRVYFQGIGWTEVVGMPGCEACVFSSIGKDKNIEYPEIECRGRQFKKLELSSSQYYVISLAFGDVSDEYETEKEAREKCERKAKAEPNVTFSVMKVIDSCCAESVVKWYEK